MHHHPIENQVGMHSPREWFDSASKFTPPWTAGRRAAPFQR
ncbi:hypothetical protein RISK_004334 [Rhodopirellula islandica]|uniref:Uncharacterized protein n=1 Tax=Rhodopirellula islandica TaxID=595434 RepID=A0A0J1BBC1_RHOIS|nr:hypothetical protein RISK_004334 [Rhodopirellula islandica]